jgi:hypothetical protein
VDQEAFRRAWDELGQDAKLALTEEPGARIHDDLLLQLNRLGIAVYGMGDDQGVVWHVASSGDLFEHLRSAALARWSAQEERYAVGSDERREAARQYRKWRDFQLLPEPKAGI